METMIKDLTTAQSRSQTDDETGEIPLLDDKIAMPSDDKTPGSFVESDKRKENPFLPYAQLEQLAREREKFRKELEQFTQRMQQQNAASPLQNAALNIASSNQTGEAGNEFINLLTQQILEQLRPQVEQMVIKHLNGNQTALYSGVNSKGSQAK